MSRTMAHIEGGLTTKQEYSLTAAIEGPRAAAIQKTSRVGKRMTVASFDYISGE